METFKLILNAKNIPDGSVVYKPTGNKPYIIKRRVEIFGLNETVNLPNNTRILCSEGTLNVINEEDLLAINFDSIQLLYKFVEHLKMKNDEC